MKNTDFEIEVKASILRKIVDAIMEINYEVKFIIDEEGVKGAINGMDKSSVVSTMLKRSACDSFKAKATEVAVDLDDLSKILKLAKSDEVVNLKKNVGENLIIISFGIIKRQFPLINHGDVKSPRVPNIPFTTIADVPADKLGIGLKAAEQVEGASAVVFKARPEALTLYAQEHASDCTATFDKELMEYYDTNGKDESIFSIEFMESGLKVAKGSGKVTLEYANESPIKISHSFEDGGLEIFYMFAPRIIKA